MVRLTLCLALGLSACSKKGKAELDDDVGDSPASTTARAAGVASLTRQLFKDYGSCEVTFEGQVARVFRNPGGMGSLGSDYFMNEDEMRQAVMQLTSDPEKLKAALAKDPRFYVLVANCGGDGMNLNVSVGEGTTYADLPFGPGHYTLGEGKGEVTLTGSLERYTKMFHAVPGGSFEIAKFDGSGLRATFSAEITGSVTGKVHGTIDYRCAHNTSVCLAARGR